MTEIDVRCLFGQVWGLKPEIILGIFVVVITPMVELLTKGNNLISHAQAD